MLGNLLKCKANTSGSEKNPDHSNFSSVVPNVPVYCKAASTGTTKSVVGVLLDTAVNVEKHSEMLPTTSPPILDHISDDLKLKLFGSRDVPYCCPINSAQKNGGLSSDKFTSINEKAYAFRILIIEEAGQMACRNNYRDIFDYTTSKVSNSMEQIRPSELKEYIFGSPVRASDLTQCDKIRTIPNSDLVLITRIFYYTHQYNRIAISLCIPKILLPVVAESWSCISSWLTQTQKMLIGFLNRNRIMQENTGNYSNNSVIKLSNIDIKIHYPKEIEIMVQTLQKRVIPCLRSMSEIPRLFLYPETFKEFVHVWFKSVFNWIEIKDGPKLGFLPLLMAMIITDYRQTMRELKTCKIVILSGNMVVANKLLFILSALLEPKYKGKIAIRPEDLEPESSAASGNRSGNSFVDKSETELSTLTSTDNLIGRAETNGNHHMYNNTGSPNFHSLRKAWQIPNRRNSNISVSVSSSESLAEVIQPSSFKSGSSSLHYLSSSISSQPGSYGSWFNKRPTLSQFFQPSPSLKHNESWERLQTTTGNLQRTSSSSSLQQATSRLSLTTPQQSPSISEYDEYPWMGTPSSPNVGDTSHAVPLVKNISYKFPLKNVDLKRDCQRISQNGLLDEAFEKLCQPSMNDLGSTYEIFPGNSSYADILTTDSNISDDLMNKPLELLPKYTMYLTHFSNFFQLQACPVGQESENRITNSMKIDLLGEDYTRSLLVSLRSRDIRDVALKREFTGSTNNNSHNVYDENFNGKRKYVLKQKTRKIFSCGKIGKLSASLENCVNFVDSSIKSAMMLYDDNGIEGELRDLEALRIFSSLVHYCNTG
ncbi:Lst4p SKDI_11G0450 [Saccharomyces kudriavzevii IFO 1802]|uniref:Uncharacterized protein n=2 Tax=Saccharomyces kudriavzevii (strain ATCC MYA-4449 / AS 2.2408 / CBS 8840 / NBRC 1802 / NCYC 2889) TaxID=226230 RepID=A0AA35J1Y9_SACK1|nr:uncharacterized protein SKDI_11G0450 [Saccharomyces kudriavzevii IFO 1802]EJT42563.1 LST4-like protein [Saccharomyces kudriavzevii IFO 1802]CAI4044439.1 hypothetical protein SKDI_11G0450 [Saccharomyces kudriavzevii IFO 1802]